MGIIMEKNLYEKDYYLWLDKTINSLKNHQFSDLDLENLIDEIKSMSISQQKILTRARKTNQKLGINPF
jgi:hypothetical protein